MNLYPLSPAARLPTLSMQPGYLPFCEAYEEPYSFQETRSMTLP